LWLRSGDDLGAIDQRGLRANDIPLASTHPQSTCKMGEVRQRSVVNSWCQSHDLRNLFVADMSVFPSSLGAPPQISTAAIADRTAQYIKGNWSQIAG
jgi:choline dehydrogenase-like flavoprotein